MATAQANSLLNSWIKLYRTKQRSAVLSLCGAGLALAVIAVFSLTVGSTAIPLQDMLGMITGVITHQPSASAYDASLYTILFTIRLPRIFMAGLVGCALAMAGAAYQGMFRNPLADPYLTGISQGAALGAVAGFLLPASLPVALIPVLGFLGAVISVIVVFFIARTGKTVPVTTLILGGVAVGAFLASFTSYLLIVSGDKLHGIIFWLLGTFSLADWSRVAIIAPYILAGITVLMLMARPLNVMQLDEEQARQLGINVEKTKVLILAAATLATASAVCFCGAIGFVGIIIPHAVRLILGPDYRLLLPFSALAGAGFLILADTAARTLLAPTEIPVGVITALIGAPFFLYLLRQKKRGIF
ncbi:MAG: iron chelate uptake ABC transporter family permease subunit [Chloroflexi bacterium]|nr:iron chelate uptake ABC transporter family permease subunit [Chloroflexota bacterium]